jgi:NAD-dependent deacetylase
VGDASGAEMLERAQTLVRGSTRILAFTGAGISAESGIPTYRDCEDSLWTRYDPDKFANIEYFYSDSSLYWRFFKDVRYQVIATAKPNPGHHALAALERAGRLSAVITQNIDGLHQAAGSREVIELHGNTRTIACLRCGRTYSMEEVHAQLQTALPPPCRACGGMLKPQVVFFGEALPEEALARAARAARACDLLIAVGSSLVVYPAAFIPLEAKRYGARLLIINKTATPADAEADAVLRDPAGEVLPRLAEAAGVGPEQSGGARAGNQTPPASAGANATGA